MNIAVNPGISDCFSVPKSRDYHRTIPKISGLNKMPKSCCFSAINARISERRTHLTGVLMYLHNPNSLQNDADDDTELFSMPTTSKIRQTVKELIERLMDGECQSEEEQTATISDVSSESEAAKVSLHE